MYTDEENDRRELTVPGVVGSTQEQAASTLQQAGFAYRVVGSGDTVTDQVPASGVRIPASGKVILYMGEDKPAEQIEVPDLTGLTPDECRDTLEQYGLYLKQKGCLLYTSIRQASEQELTRVLPRNAAQAVYDFFHKED